MKPAHRIGSISAFLMFCTLTILLPVTVSAYSQYSTDGGSTNCAQCHGDFRANNYTSLADGQDWGNLHNLHRNTMLNGDCDTCHQSGDRFPVLLDDSVGGSGLDPIGCMGCHGRAQDNNPGAGLRQHHFSAGVTLCFGCHVDADPANYTPAGEETPPPYYANPGTGHPSMPTDSCNDDGSEDFAGLSTGLDNNGDDLYDGDDPGCGISGVSTHSFPTASLLQNHPNPFNPSTHIKYVLDGPGHVRLQVFSVNGELVRTLVNAQHDQAMTYQVTWDGRNKDGRALPSGVFFYRLESPGGVEMKKMVLLK